MSKFEDLVVKKTLEVVAEDSLQFIEILLRMSEFDRGLYKAIAAAVGQLSEQQLKEASELRRLGNLRADLDAGKSTQVTGLKPFSVVDGGKPDGGV